MKNFKLILLGLFVLISSAIYGQQSITAAGGVFQNTKNSMSWGIGEVAIQTLFSDDYILTQGFQQSLLIITAIDETPHMDVSVSVYPNPINNFVKIDLNAAHFSDFEYQLFGQKGDAIEQKRFDAESIEISFQNLNAGIYFLKVMDGNDYSQTFKIVKN